MNKIERIDFEMKYRYAVQNNVDIAELCREELHRLGWGGHVFISPLPLDCFPTDEHGHTYDPVAVAVASNGCDNYTFEFYF